jgi:glutamine---fructose-6-phosphate transaminase (isomerizing)
MIYRSRIFFLLHRLIRRIFRLVIRRIFRLFPFPVYFGRYPSRLPNHSIVFFPCCRTSFSCGLAGIVTLNDREAGDGKIDIDSLEFQVETVEGNGYENGLSVKTEYLGGREHVRSLLRSVRGLKQNDPFFECHKNKDIGTKLTHLSSRIKDIIEREGSVLTAKAGHLEQPETEMMASRIEDLKDIYWCLTTEIADNIEKIDALTYRATRPVSLPALQVFKEINTVLNSIDRLEVRGRDSAGISVMFLLAEPEFHRYQAVLKELNIFDQFSERAGFDVLLNRGIHFRNIENQDGSRHVSVTVTYKVAAEIGSLGDNVNFLREQIRDDVLLQTLVTVPYIFHTVLSHTRWASVGAITEANCHPVDNRLVDAEEGGGWIHVCLNGDIDNFMELKTHFEETGGDIHKDISTDTKMIPLQIGKYIHQGFGIEEAFRRSLNDFQGSHAIAMHTDLAPGKLFLGQRGSGQAIFVGIGKDHYLCTSEVYGFVEETDSFIKMDGDLVVSGKNGKTQGQIFILDQASAGGLEGIQAMFYDGTPIHLQEKDIKKTDITSRDIDRQGYPHYFLKEISEAPASVEKTLQNRWKIHKDHPDQYMVTLDEKNFPESLHTAFAHRHIRRVFFIGQGTAGVAALACANILRYYLNDTAIYISARKASELSGFSLNALDGADSMADTLVVAISQSGTTTDTNRTVDMVKERGAKIIAIVNRRDSDLSFKVDGVMYTSSGRDIEMSVASTKAFYSQIVAGAILSLHIACLTDRRDASFVSNEIKALLRLPAVMQTVLSKHREIDISAKRLATTKTDWAAVGSGPNKAAADEIRIKLSELCYKTISSDFIEDKKHIDLSSEPLILVCAAGARDSVIGDIIKDTAIFKAHKAAPVVIANEGEHRFGPYAEDVFNVPVVDEHLAPIVNTLVGHIWGYYAALAINEGSRLFYGFRREIQQSLEAYDQEGMDVYEIMLEKAFREKFAQFYRIFRARRDSNPFPTAISLASDLTLLLKYFSGRLPVSEFELDFGKKGTALNMLNTLFACLGESINRMARPIDAIKHQAKTVTVGTSRISDKMEGILYDTLSGYNFNVSQLTPSNIIVLRNLQDILLRVNGSILYRINHLNLLGEASDETTIQIVEKRGVLISMPSRVETDPVLKGTKRIIVKEGNVYIGLGRTDGRSILIVPVISDEPSTSSTIEYLLLLNISFRENLPLGAKKKALGGKFERIKSIVQESSLTWDDRYIELLEMKELFGRSAEKVAEFMISQVRSKN